MHRATSAQVQHHGIWKSYLIPVSPANYVCSENILLYFKFLQRLLFVYWSDYSLKQEIDIKPTMLSLAARAAQAACAMIAQNISHLHWYKIATTKRTKAKRILKPNRIDWNTFLRAY